MCNYFKRASGFTLLELMVTIAVASVLIGLAIPSFSDMMRNNRLTTYTNELVTALNLARSEAVKRAVQVTILRKSATNSVWESGWEVFVDNNGDGIRNGTDALLRDYPQLTTGYTIRSGANYSCWLAFTSAGVVRASNSSCTGGGLSNDSFRVCDPSADKTISRTIALNTIGRARTTKGSVSCP